MAGNTFLIVDGLPASSGTSLLVQKLTQSGHHVVSVSFTENLHDLSAASITNTLTEHLAAAVSYGKPVTIIASSFGAYVIAHSNGTLLPFSDTIQHIHLYSPIAKLADVTGIETLADYLNKTYDSRLTTADLLLLDHTFAETALLDEPLSSKTYAAMGSRDSQVPLESHQNHFRRFTLTVHNTDHIGMNHNLIQEGPYQ